MAYDNELNEWRREQAYLRAESETEEGRLRILHNSGDLDDDETDEEGEDAATGRVSGYMPDDTYDEDDDDIELEDEPEIDEREPSPDLTDDDVSEPIPAVLPTAEDLDAVANEQSIAEATATTGNDYWHVVDQRCDCGHLRSQHGDTIAKGHGRCAVASCSCSKFTWASFVTAPAAQPKAKKKSKSVRKPKPARVSKSGVKRPPAKPKKGKEGKGKK